MVTSLINQTQACTFAKSQKFLDQASDHRVVLEGKQRLETKSGRWL